jgi:hypothetical protein
VTPLSPPLSPAGQAVVTGKSLAACADLLRAVGWGVVPLVLGWGALRWAWCFAVLGEVEGLQSIAGCAADLVGGPTAVGL